MELNKEQEAAVWSFLQAVKRIYSQYGIKEPFGTYYRSIHQPSELKDVVGIVSAEIIKKTIQRVTDFQSLNIQQFAERIMISKAETFLITFLKKTCDNFKDKERFGKFLKREISERRLYSEDLRSLYVASRSMQNEILGSIVTEELQKVDARDEKIFIKNVLERVEPLEV